MKRSTLVVATLVLAGCEHRQDEAAKPVVTVKIARAEIADVQSTVRAPATIFPSEQASISARMTAPIRELRVRKGDKVAAGQVLAVLESSDIAAQREEARAALSDAEASLQKLAAGTLPSDIERARGQVTTTEAVLNQAQKIYDRRSELYKQRAIPGRDLLTSQTELEQARANADVARKTLTLLEGRSRENDLKIAESRIQQAKARLALAEAQLHYTQIRSPFEGVVTEQFAYPGDMAKPDTPMFTVTDLRRPVARGQVSEAEAGPVRLGQPCSFESSDEGSASGVITVVGKTVDPARRTVEVWCEIAKPGASLRANSFGTLQILTGTVPGAVTVPPGAVQFVEGTRRGAVYVVDGKRIARRVEVETGARTGDRVEVKSGIHVGDLVIVEGAYGLPDGTEVQYPGARK
jgi:RND family efflux transporter MFP subunit